jgi:hypothetical protein
MPTCDPKPDESLIMSDLVVEFDDFSEESLRKAALKRLGQAVKKRRKADGKECSGQPCDDGGACNAVMLMSFGDIAAVYGAVAKALREGEIEVHDDGHFSVTVGFEINIKSECRCR